MKKLNTTVFSTDVTSILVQANMSANEEDKLPEDELLGQMACVSSSHGSPFTLTPNIAQDVHLRWHGHDVERARPHS